MIADRGIERLQCAAALCQEAADENVRWLGNAIVHVLHQRAIGESASLERELGLEFGALLGYRDEQIRAARRCFAGLKVTPAAKEISKLARRIRAGASLRVDSPGLDEARKLIAEALRTGLDFPKERHLLNILGTQ